MPCGVHMHPPGPSQRHSEAKKAAGPPPQCHALTRPQKCCRRLVQCSGMHTLCHAHCRRSDACTSSASAESPPEALLFAGRRAPVPTDQSHAWRPGQLLGGPGPSIRTISAHHGRPGTHTLARCPFVPVRYPCPLVPSAALRHAPHTTRTHNALTHTRTHARTHARTNARGRRRSTGPAIWRRARRLVLRQASAQCLPAAFLAPSRPHSLARTGQHTYVACATGCTTAESV